MNLFGDGIIVISLVFFIIAGLIWASFKTQRESADTSRAWQIRHRIAYLCAVFFIAIILSLLHYSWVSILNIQEDIKKRQETGFATPNTTAAQRQQLQASFRYAEPSFKVYRGCTIGFLISLNIIIFAFSYCARNSSASLKRYPDNSFAILSCVAMCAHIPYEELHRHVQHILQQHKDGTTITPRQILDSWNGQYSTAGLVIGSFAVCNMIFVIVRLVTGLVVTIRETATDNATAPDPEQGYQLQDLQPVEEPQPAHSAQLATPATPVIDLRTSTGSSLPTGLFQSDDQVFGQHGIEDPPPPQYPGKARTRFRTDQGQVTEGYVESAGPPPSYSPV
ncbi:MAG: hypothetical protein M1820_001800 [Bogoriella megaspora]|nr:MAG: hypothetical protein M1820_001800 [Bogoriella megaspora]